jgi:integrase
MGYSKAQKEKTHERIVAITSKRFREQGLAGFGIAELIKEAGLMSVLFNYGCRHELFDRNPIYFVRQSAKRRTPPTILVPAEIKALIDGLALRERTLVLLAASTGLRQSEIFGLKWGDIDFERGAMNVTRSS